MSSATYALTAEEIAALRRLTDRDGTVATAARLKLARHTVERALAALPVRQGSVVMIRLGLGLLAPEATT